LPHFWDDASVSTVTARLPNRKGNNPPGEDKREKDDRAAKKLRLNGLARLFFHLA
jgi:hypothetical protein